MAEIRINTTGGLKLYDADNSHYAQIVAGTITSNVDAITLGHDTVTIADNLSLGSDSAILKLGADGDATLTHDGTTGLTIAATPISIDSTGELHLNSTTGDIKLQDGGTDQIAFDLDGTAGEVIMKPAVDSDDLVISQYDGTEVIRIEDNASLGLVGNKLSIANSSSDVVIKPLTDAKDIIFQQYDGTEVARIEDNATFNIPASKLAIGGTAVTATAAELNLLDGGTSVGSSITLADADGFVVNDGGTMKTIPASDISTYAGGTLVETGSTTGTGSSVGVTNCFSSTYDFYTIHFYFHFANNGSALRFRIVDSGGERGESQYQYSSRMFESQGSSGSHTGESADYIEIINSGSQGYDDGGVHGILHVHLNNGHGTASHSNTFSMAGFYKSSPDNSVNRVRAYYHASNYIDTITNHTATGFNFFASSGNLEISNVKVYGLKGSGT
jgi:hypothetical protein